MEYKYVERILFWIFNIYINILKRFISFYLINNTFT